MSTSGWNFKPNGNTYLDATVNNNKKLTMLDTKGVLQTIKHQCANIRKIGVHSYV